MRETALRLRGPVEELLGVYLGLVEPIWSRLELMEEAEFVESSCVDPGQWMALVGKQLSSEMIGWMAWKLERTYFPFQFVFLDLKKLSLMLLLSY